MGFEVACHLVAVHFGEQHIQDDEIGQGAASRFLQGAKGCYAVFEGLDREPGAPQANLEDLAHHLRVVDDQNVSWALVHALASFHVRWSGVLWREPAARTWVSKPTASLLCVAGEPGALLASTPRLCGALLDKKLLQAAVASQLLQHIPFDAVDLLH